MLYIIEVNYKREELPILDVWEFLESYDVSDGCYGSTDLATNGELMAFNDFDEFKEWTESEMDEDPIFLVIDTEDQSLYYYEVNPTVIIERLEGVLSKEERKAMAEAVRKAKQLEEDARHREFLLKQKADLDARVKALEEKIAVVSEKKD